MSTQSPPLQEVSTSDDWRDAFEAVVEEAGYLERLGQRHWAFFVDEGPVLLVTFERLSDVRARGAGALPLLHGLAQKNGWSHLCLLAEGETWYRDPRVWGYFDRLVDEGFFEDFDRVMFHGAGMGGYAACAFSVVAPGATVLAIAPRASLARDVASWDRRDLGARGLDFTSRYGYAPDMIDGAQAVFTMHDPRVDADAMHAALFRKPWVKAFRCPQLGADPETHLHQMGVLEPLVEAACAGTLTPALWARLWRGRRDYGPWVRSTQILLAEQGNPLREALFLRAALARVTSRRLRNRYQELSRTLRETEGIVLEEGIEA